MAQHHLQGGHGNHGHHGHGGYHGNGDHHEYGGHHHGYGGQMNDKKAMKEAMKLAKNKGRYVSIKREGNVKQILMQYKLKLKLTKCKGSQAMVLTDLLNYAFGCNKKKLSGALYSPLKFLHLGFALRTLLLI